MAAQQPTRTIAGITVIDTPLIRAALDYAKTHNDPMSFNHTHRSWLFGCIMASKLPAFSNIDFEIHAVATVLHDLAWDLTSPFASTDKRFEVDSANAARDFLKREAPHYDHRRIQLVWDAIAIHSTPSLAAHKEPEVALCNMGIGADFTGPGFPGGLITKEEYLAVIEELPLLGLKEGVKKLMCALCVHKPETTYDNFVRDYGDNYVEGYDSTGKTAHDYMMQPID
ncbi:hypothetical protein BJY04DRAFT_226572, partial [Aspergillus karnatakaensis]|uniref:uncharacterized protein n=1 Tax=Aspergillus karnatakaensis TaxID=1810916 RepID=UPI003CCC985B